jgi:hypothetical protein
MNSSGSTRHRSLQRVFIVDNTKTQSVFHAVEHEESECNISEISLHYCQVEFILTSLEVSCTVGVYGFNGTRFGW